MRYKIISIERNDVYRVDILRKCLKENNIGSFQKCLKEEEETMAWFDNYVKELGNKNSSDNYIDPFDGLDFLFDDVVE